METTLLTLHTNIIEWILTVITPSYQQLQELFEAEHTHPHPVSIFEYLFHLSLRLYDKALISNEEKNKYILCSTLKINSLVRLLCQLSHDPFFQWNPVPLPATISSEYHKFIIPWLYSWMYTSNVVSAAQFLLWGIKESEEIYSDFTEKFVNKINCSGWSEDIGKYHSIFRLNLETTGWR